MLPKTLRLVSPDLHVLLSHPKRVSLPGFLLLYTITNVPGPRFAVWAGKKVSKSAVKRNTNKRILRELLRSNTWNLPGGFAGVLVCTADNSSLSKDTLKTTLTTLFSQVSPKISV